MKKINVSLTKNEEQALNIFLSGVDTWIDCAYACPYPEKRDGDRCEACPVAKALFTLREKLGVSSPFHEEAVDKS